MLEARGITTPRAGTTAEDSAPSGERSLWVRRVPACLSRDPCLRPCPDSGQLFRGCWGSPGRGDMLCRIISPISRAV